MVSVLWECGMECRGSSVRHQKFTFSSVRIRLSLFSELVKFLRFYFWTSVYGTPQKNWGFQGNVSSCKLRPFETPWWVLQHLTVIETKERCLNIWWYWAWGLDFLCMLFLLSCSPGFSCLQSFCSVSSFVVFYSQLRFYQRSGKWLLQHFKELSTAFSRKYLSFCICFFRL